MNVVCYFREALAEKSEYLVAERYLRVVDRRTAIARGELVVCRYSALPYNRELCLDVQTVGATMLNDARAHAYLANLENWYADLEGYTPRTWFRMEDVPDWAFPVVVKGQTNSRKSLWSTHMFAKDRPAMVEVAIELMRDSMLGEQGIVIRQYVPLRSHGTGLHGLPISHEFRFFVLDGKVIGEGFYWSEQYDELPDPKPSPNEVPRAWLQDRIDAVKAKARFLVIDVAQAETGEWTVIELNDGQMSGLCMCDPEPIYQALGALDK